MPARARISLTAIGVSARTVVIPWSETSTMFTLSAKGIADRLSMS
jgi:hypothetical protein